MLLERVSVVWFTDDALLSLVVFTNLRASRDHISALPALVFNVEGHSWRWSRRGEEVYRPAEAPNRVARFYTLLKGAARSPGSSHAIRKGS